MQQATRAPVSRWGQALACDAPFSLLQSSCGTPEIITSGEVCGSALVRPLRVDEPHLRGDAVRGIRKPELVAPAPTGRL